MMTSLGGGREGEGLHSLKKGRYLQDNSCFFLNGKKGEHVGCGKKGVINTGASVRGERHVSSNRVRKPTRQ